MWEDAWLDQLVLMSQAQQRIIDEIPGAAHLLSGLRFEPGAHPTTGTPLERGWICNWSNPDAWPADTHPTGADT
jgi:hypothetical protein